jgi:hypothetical protein
MNLFSRSYEPWETILEPGKSVTSLMLLTKGHIAVCEPSKNQEPICILKRGNYFGDFHILKHVPCFFAVKAVSSRDFSVNQDGHGNSYGVFFDDYYDRQQNEEIQSYDISLHDEKCTVMCFDSKAFLILCKLYKKSKQVLAVNATIRN